MFSKQDFIKKNYGYIIIFIIFLAFLLKQFKNVYIYFDDFGYLSLSYGYIVTDVIGSEYNLMQFLEYMYNHYLVVNGRLLYASLLPFMNMLFGINGVKYVMPIIIVIILLLIFREIKGNQDLTSKKSVLLAIFICLLYGTISIYIHNQGTYWFAASYLYITPLIVFLIFSNMYYRTMDSEDVPSQKKQVLLVVLAFIAGFSSEQWLSAAIGFILIIILMKLYKKVKIKIYDFLVLILAFVGGLPILTSPAVRDRMNNNQAFMELKMGERILGNADNIVNTFFSTYNKLYLIVFVTILIVLTLYLIEKKKGNLYVHLAYISASVYLLYKVVTLKDIYLSGEKSLSVVILILYLLWSLLQIVIFYKDEVNKFPIYIMLAAYISLACLVIVPEIPLRVMLPFIFLSFILFGDIFLKVIVENFKLSCMLIIFLAMLAVPNLITIYNGYKENYEILAHNEHVLNEYDGNGEVVLTKSKDLLYGSAMMYFEGLDYIKYWMIEYYDLPESTTIIYIDGN